MLQPTESDFNRRIYILASVHHIMDHAAHPPPICDLAEKKDLELLNYLAFLLVTKPHGDVAAVTMEISTSAINFYYAKNRPCASLTQLYVDKILKALRENVLSAIPKSVLMIVMVECVHKVRNRIKKCQQALEESERLGISKLKSLSGNRYANTLKPWAGQNDSKILRSFFNELQSFDTSISIMRSQPVTSMLMSQKACVIGTIIRTFFIHIIAFLM